MIMMMIIIIIIKDTGSTSYFLKFSGTMKNHEKLYANLCVLLYFFLILFRGARWRSGRASDS